MDHDEFFRILDKPPEARTPAERDRLEAAMAASPELARLARKIDDTLELWRQAPRVEPVSHLMDAVWRRIDQEAETPEIGQPVREKPPRPGRPGWATGWGTRIHRVLRPALPGVLGAVATVALVLVYLPDDPRDIQTKGQADVAGEPSVDLQVVIASRDGSTYHPADDLSVLQPNEGVYFRFVVERATYLALVERDPRHRLSLIYERSDLTIDEGETVVDIVDDTGALLRFVLPERAGEYTYIAVAADRAPPEQTNTWLDTVWNLYVDHYVNVLSGSDMPGIDLDAIRLVKEDPGWGSGKPGETEADETPSTWEEEDD